MTPTRAANSNDSAGLAAAAARRRATGRARRCALSLLGAALSLAALLPPRAASADRTTLLKVDLRTGRKRAIDARRRTSADRELDSLLGKAMGKKFSTADLARIEKALRRYIRAARPRARARLLLFLYPGNITKAGLKELREVLVDIDLVIDPCGRSVCRDSVGKHLELIGKSLRQAVIRTRDYKIRFKSVTIRTTTHIGNTNYDIYRFGARQAITAARGHNGARLVRKIDRARSGWARAMTRAITRQLKIRRLRLRSTPSVVKESGSVTVTIGIRSDRVRIKRDVINAIRGAAKALVRSAHTPSSGQLVVKAMVQRRRRRQETYSCPLSAARNLARGRTSSRELWSSYVAHKRRGARSLTFSDADASGRSSGGGGSGFSAEAARRTLVSNMQSKLAPCLQKAARRSRRFRGVTLIFWVSKRGRATRVRTKERAPRVRRCLARGLRGIRFARHRGPAQQVTFPMYISR